MLINDPTWNLINKCVIVWIFIKDVFQTVGAFLENNVTNSDDRAIVLMHSTLLINVNLCDIGKVRKQFFWGMIKAILRIN